MSMQQIIPSGGGNLSGRSINTTAPIVGGGNLGADLTLGLDFSNTYTVAQLNGLGGSASSKLRVAYCSDCLNSGASSAGIQGSFVFWNGAAWMTFSDNIPITTSFFDYVALMHLRSRSPQIITPYAMHLQGAQFLTAGFNSSNTGTASLGQSSGGSNDLLGWRYSYSTGTTVSSTSLVRLNRPTGTVFGAGQRRNVGIAVTLTDFVTSASATDYYAFRIGLQSAETGASTYPTSFVGIIFDDRGNIYGQGNDSNLRAVARANSTDLLAPTSIGIGSATPNTTVICNVLIVATIEPITTTTARVRVGYQQANNTFTFLADKAGSYTLAYFTDGSTTVTASGAIKSGDTVKY
ncbi:MAG: hypothetical protein EBZ77_16045, partial [Chitinophagia bacterium]|nr:hypothetical protein [Chitinophagia bacterium]